MNEFRSNCFYCKAWNSKEKVIYCTLIVGVLSWVVCWLPSLLTQCYKNMATSAGGSCIGGKSMLTWCMSGTYDIQWYMSDNTTLWYPQRYLCQIYNKNQQFFHSLRISKICLKDKEASGSLFKDSNGLASLLFYTRKKFFGWGLQIFCKWRHKWSSFWAILVHVTWPRSQPLGQSILLKFLLETWLESKPLIDFLSFLVQKLNTLINYLIS